uniref:Uncharacterized protein n=1 Tax=Rhizophora mucronata TaxID=61149 RepID=A0A2P2NZ99_RHIMU
MNLVARMYIIEKVLFKA